MHVFIETPTPQNNNQISNNEEADRSNNDTNKPPLRKVIINIIHHLTLVGITIYIIYTSFENGISLFSWHPTLMMIGVNKKIYYTYIKVK